MHRLMLTNEHWSKLKTIMFEADIYDKPIFLLNVEGMLYRMRVGCPWRDLPDFFGCWNMIYKRFNAWSKAGKWKKIFTRLVSEPDT